MQSAEIFNYLGYTLSILFFIGWLFVWLLHIMAILNGKYKLHKRAIMPNDVPLPGVSIIKPLVGSDTNLTINLESFFTMNYASYEILFCIHDEKDSSLTCVQKLMRKYPDVDASIFIGGKKVGVNPKINNMYPGYANAKYDYILISDSGIRMKEDTLLDMVLQMKEDVGLVHQVPFTCDRKGFSSTLEKVYFGTAHARIYLSADFVGVNCPTGMSALMRKSLIDEVGGLDTFANYLAEDFFLAKSLTDRGWKLQISSQPAWQNPGVSDIDTFKNRLTRWAKLRFAMVPHTIFLEPFSECFILCLFAALSINFLFGFDPFVVGLFHILVWFLLDYMLLNVIQCGDLPFSKTEYVTAWVFRESVAFLWFAKALIDPQIRWRTGIYKLEWGGIARQVVEEQEKI